MQGSRTSPAGLKHRAHLLMDQVDRLEWPEHHFELYDPPLLVPFQHVGPIDADAVDLLLALIGSDKEDEPESTEFVGRSDQRDAASEVLDVAYEAEEPSDRS